MRRFAGKLAFVHRTLWERGHAYRWAVLLGPPPLIGIGAALLVLAALHSGPDAREESQVAPWAHWTRSVARDGQPFTEAAAPLPRKEADGRYSGFVPGWHGVIQPLSVDATMTTTLSQANSGAFTLSEPAISLSRIVDAGPPAGLFVGTLNAWFVVQTPGIYTFSAQLARSGTQSANCLLWLETPKHRMFRSLQLDTSGQAVIGYDTTAFKLEPGLLHLLLATGCWRGDRMIGAGEVTVTVRRPGQATAQPVTADELLSAVRK